MEKKWYQKTVWIISLLIVVTPIGLYLVFKYLDWPKAVKYALLVAYVGFIGYNVYIQKESPVITLNSEATVYKAGAELTEEEIVNDYVSEVSDNNDELKKEDVTIYNYDSLDFSEPGKQQLYFQLEDSDGHVGQAKATYVSEE